MKKRIISALLAAVMLIAMVPTAAFAENENSGSITIEGKEGTYNTIAEAVKAAKADDTIVLAAGEYDAPEAAIEKRVNLKSTEGAVINGAVTYKFSEVQNAALSVEGITFNATESSKVTGLLFRGDKPNDGYDLTVSDCVFNGWSFGVGVYSHANGYDLTVSGCTFDSICAVNFNFDDSTEGQIANNTLTFSGENAVNGAFAVQKYNNSKPTSFNKYYETIADFENDENGVAGDAVKFVANDTALKNAVTAEGAYIVLTDDIEVSSKITVNENITIDGRGHTIKASDSWSGTENTDKQLLGIEGSAAANAVVKNITLDSNSRAFGFQPYDVNDTVYLSNVILKNSKGTGMTVNGSSVVADNLTVSGSGWGQSIDVSNGVGIEGSPMLTLTNSDLQDSVGIFEDIGGNAEPNGAVVVVDGETYAPHKNETLGKWIYLADMPVKIGEKGYWTLADAVEAVIESDSKTGTVTLTQDMVGTGIGLFNSKGAVGVNLTVDFGGHTYTCADPAVGSAGTETQGFHLEKGNTVTLKNGTINVAETSTKTKMLIQNYCDLTLSNLKLQGGDITQYIVSCNYGNMVLNNVSIDGTYGNLVAVDLMHWIDMAVYKDKAPTMKIDNRSEDQINGSIDVYCYNNGVTECDDKPELSITGGTFSLDPTEYVASGYSVKESGGKYTVYYPSTGGGTTTPSNPDKTETVTNPDGSTTTTVTKPDGTVTETTKQPDGSTTVTTTKPDGSSVTTVDNKDGSSSKTTVSAEGKTESYVKLPSAVVDNAEKNGEAVELPIPEVTASKDADKAPKVTVDLPAGTAVKVEIPVDNVNAGVVAVLVHADGTEEIIKTSVPTENGIEVKVEDGATLKIVDNSKDFADVAESHWGADAVDFAASREIFDGTSETTFEPETAMTRAMVVTVLARLDGVDTAGDVWYEAGAEWAKENGISDGTNLNAMVSREQLVTMLYRYAGSPEVEGQLAGYPDAESVSGYAEKAMIWAVENGIITGADGKIAPQGDATRVQVAAILMRFIDLMQ